jgi:signal transduction histidine kinase/DNA-binding response OmpR family regulator
MKFWKRSLLAQLVGYFSLLSVVTVSTVSISAYNRARDSLEQSVIDRLTVATALKEFQLNEWVTSQREDVLLISQLPEIQQQIAILLTHSKSSSQYAQAYQRLTKYFADLTAVKPNVRNIIITTNGGFVVFSSLNKDLEGRYKPLGEPTTYFTRQGASAVVPNFYTASSTGKAAITFGAPLLDAKRVQMGAITVDLDLIDIDRLIREDTGLGITAETYLVGRAGAKTTLIARGEAMQDTSSPSATASGKAPNKFENGIHSPGIDAAIAKNNAQGLSENYAGVPVIGVYRWLTDQNLAIVAEINQDEAFLPARQLAREILLIGLSSAGLLLVAVYLLSRRMTQPILAIADTAIHVAKGDLTLRAPVLTQDEIGVLALAFNQMTGQLEQSNQQLSDYSRTLEQRISEATQDLQDTLAYLASIMDNMADGLLVTDKEGCISRYNPALLKMFNLPPKELVGQTCQAVFGEDVSRLVAVAQSSQQALTVQIALAEDRIGKASATAILKDSSQPLLIDGPLSNTTSRASSSASYIGAVILIQDITSEKEVDRMKTDFISTVSHELRTPLTSVLGFAKIIKKKFQESLMPLIQTDDKKVKRTIQQVGDNIDIIVTEGERLTALINDVLDLAKMEAGRVDWNMQPIAADELIERAIACTAALFEQKHLELRRVIEPNLPTVEGDRDRLIQVVINLISNAVKFTNTGAITCEVKRDRDMVVISITDSGIGIAEADKPKVFEKFKQVGDTLTDKPKGTGLGLPICKEIVEHHGGKIWVESELGTGSTFAFSLPLSPIQEHSAQANPVQESSISTPMGCQDWARGINLETLVKHLKEQVGTSILPADRPKTILVVDDDANIRKLLRQELETEGYGVREARSGREAIAQIKQVLPDLIILDVIMPDLNGFDVAAVSKNDPQTSDIPIIILSSLEDRERGSGLGVDCYLTKPINTEVLLRDVEKLVCQHSARKTALIMDKNTSKVNSLVEVLRSRGYDVVEVSSSQDLIDKTISFRPSIVIANATYAKQHGIVKTLRSETGLENLCFFLMDDE